jgi:GntR family transcriptional regulator
MTSRKLVRNPLYVQLKQILKELTKSDEFRVGDKFLTERQISERFDVSRVTANKALSNLVAEGVLSFRKGIGTFLEDTSKDSNFPGVSTSFTNKTLAAGKKPSTRMLGFARTRTENLPAHVISRFPASPGEEIVRVERLRLADDVPMILERHFFRSAVVPGLAPEDVRVSVYDMLTKKYHQRFSTLEETIRTVVLGGQNAHLLGVAHGTPGFLMFFMTRNLDNEPLYFAEVIYRGDAYEFHNRLGPIQKTHTLEEGPAEFSAG